MEDQNTLKDEMKSFIEKVLQIVVNVKYDKRLENKTFLMRLSND